MQPSSTAMVRPISNDEPELQQAIAERVGPRNFEHWFRDKTTFEVQGEELIVGVGSPFLSTWMQRHFREPVGGAAQALLGHAARVVFRVDSRVMAARDASPRTTTTTIAQAAPLNETGAPLHATAVGETQSRGRQAVPPSGTSASEGRDARAGRFDRPDRAAPASSPPRPVRTGRRFADLDEFVVGECNLLARTAAGKVAEAPGASYSPLYLYGGVGSGKTHLLEGIHRRIRRAFPALSVTFLTSEAFANYFTEALRDRTLPSFRHKFRTVDVLLVDDVDFLDGKRAMQEEFLHTIKQLESQGRQVVVAADRHPRLLSRLSDELTTRFQAGLVCRLEPPDAETRRRIVQAKSAKSEADIAPEALDFVAQRFRNNVRELEGALNCLATWHGMTSRRVTLSTARQVLADMERDCARVVRLTDIESAVCAFFGVDPHDLRSSKRHRTISRPRMLAMFLARKHTQSAYSEIGNHFGGRNHSTVMSAERNVRKWIDERTTIHVGGQPWGLGEVVEMLEQQLQAG
ncbi:MAG: chromosomal replication initiator protein DnaA [Planctomycetaceae bacterium]